MKESLEVSMANRRSEPQNRADKVRARRQQSQKQVPSKPLGTQATRKQTNRSVPVTRRTSPTPKMVSRQGRKVNVPLKSKGAEIQLPAFPRIKFGWRLISGALCFLSFAIIISFIGFSSFEVNAIDLEGAQRYSGTVILSQTDLLGKAIIALKPDEIEEQVLERFPGIKSADVSVGLPASVTIKVVERQPVILWQQENNALWIDGEGVMFPIIGEAEVQAVVIANSDPPAAPTVEDMPEEETAEINAEEESEALLALLNETVNTRTTPEFVQGTLSMINYVPEGSALAYDTEFGLGWQDPQGWLVYFGMDIESIDIKLLEYQTIVAELQKDGIIPALISLEFLDAPFYRLEQ